jgi:hypothetical protein
MDKKARFMEAVAEKVGRRKPMMRRKGAPSVIIAIGAPKKPPMADEMDEKSEDTMEGEDKMKMSKAEKIAMLQEKIAGLKAELALLEDEDEMDEDEKEYEDEEESEDESEGEY